MICQYVKHQVSVPLLFTKRRAHSLPPRSVVPGVSYETQTLHASEAASHSIKAAGDSNASEIPSSLRRPSEYDYYISVLLYSRWRLIPRSSCQDLYLDNDCSLHKNPSSGSATCIIILACIATRADNMNPSGLDQYFTARCTFTGRRTL